MALLSKLMMSKRDRTRSDGVLFVAPDVSAQGGIATVIANYQRTEFWVRRGCWHFATYKYSSHATARIAYSLWRYALFPFVVLARWPAVVSIHTASSGSFYRKMVYVLISRVCARRVVLHIHPASFYDFFANGNVLQRCLVSMAFGLSSKILFLSEGAMQKFRLRFPTADMAVLGNPVDLAPFDKCMRAPMMGNYRLLFLGWIVREKGVFDILDAIPSVVKRFPEAHFDFAGNKEVEQLRSAIERRGLTAYASVIGWVEGDAKCALLMKSRMLLLPSYTEGVPNVILEAMAAGLPAITTAVGGIPSVFIEGINGYFVTPGDPTGLASRIVSMLSDDADCERISRLTQEAAEKQFAIGVFDGVLERAYRSYLS